MLFVGTVEAIYGQREGEILLMRIASRTNGRALRIETLETRALLSAVPASIAGASIFQNATITAEGDMVIPIHAQMGDTALEKVFGIAQQIDTLENALDAYLNSVPGWHLTGGIDTTPEYACMIDGSVVIGANGLLKSASLAVTGSADIGGSIEGYYGISVLHVGLGASLDLSANVNAYASFSVATNDWDFGGSASLIGYAKGYGSAMAWPLKGEIFIEGDVKAGAALNSDTGIASASVVVVGSVGADAQLKSLFGGWKTIASVSKTLGSWQYSASFDVGSWIQSQVNGVVVTNQAVRVSALATTAVQAKATDVSVASLAAATSASQEAVVGSLAAALVADGRAADGVSASLLSQVNGLSTSNAAAKMVVAASPLAASVHASAIQQLSTANLLAKSYWAA